MQWRGKKVGILGAGIEGISSALFFSQQGAAVTVLDENPADTQGQAGTFAEKRIQVRFATNAFADLESFDLLVRSPGVNPARKELQAAKKHGTSITSQTQLFFDQCPCPVIGVTGTKGKGTTSSLIYEMLKKAGFAAYLGGNIGKPPLDFLPTLTPQAVVVLELSSFQLVDVSKSPHIAVMLMIVPEHLNYHQDMAEYVSAKRNILKYQAKADSHDLSPQNPHSFDT